MKFNKPTLIIDKSKSLENIRMMCQKAKKNGVVFRPHFKTHQMLEVGEWYRKFGIEAITVSSVEMASFFAKAGWEDITIAFPCNILEIVEINQLASKIKLNVLIESIETLDFILQNIKNKLGIFIKIDIGGRRTGIIPENISLAEQIIEKLKDSRLLNFKGFLAHAGQNYIATSRQEIIANHLSGNKILSDIKKRFSNTNDEIKISIGDTPACSISEDFEGIDEIRPGNFVFYDLMQFKLGSCNLSQIAVAVVCPIVAIHKTRNQIVIYGGAVHFSKEHLLENDRNLFGYVVKFQANGWTIIKNCYLVSVSQEHGIVECSREFLGQISVGDIIGLLPVHSCLTVNLMRENYLVIRNEK